MPYLTNKTMTDFCLTENVFVRGSDLFSEVKFTDCDGNRIPVPLYDFEFEYIGGGVSVKAGRKDGVLFNCVVEGEEEDLEHLAVCVDAPEFMGTELRRKATLFIPDTRFSDDSRKECYDDIIAVIK